MKAALHARTLSTGQGGARRGDAGLEAFVSDLLANALGDRSLHLRLNARHELVGRGAVHCELGGRRLW